MNFSTTRGQHVGARIIERVPTTSMEREFSRASFDPASSEIRIFGARNFNANRYTGPHCVSQMER